MLDFLTENDREWLQEIYGKLDRKILQECRRLGSRIPYIPENGRYRTDLGTTDIAWWTNGFWGGLLWQLYHATERPEYRRTAEEIEERLDRSLEEYENLHHDVGFMWMHTAVANFRLTGMYQRTACGESAGRPLQCAGELYLCVERKQGRLDDRGLSYEPVAFILGDGADG